MKQHLDLMKDILENGTVKGDRTGTGTISKFGGMMKFSVQHGLWPIPTTREVNHAQISQELEWMIKGLISVQWLKDHKNPIWNSWAGDQSGTIGPMYGEQWRNWNAAGGLTKEVLEGMLAKAQKSVESFNDFKFETVMDALKTDFFEQIAAFTKPYEQGGRSGTDQFMYIVDELKNNPDSRRMCLSVWHASLLPDVSMSPKDNADAGRMALAPCHSMWQVDTKELSEIEILRQIAYEDSVFGRFVNKELENHADKASTEAVEIIRIMASLWLVKTGYAELHKEEYVKASGEVGQRFMEVGNDRNLEITPAGKFQIKAYLEAGKPTRKLSLLCFARSQDTPLGTVYNVGEYSLLAHYLAHLTNMVPWEYTHFMGDHHIYANQVECVNKQLERTPMKPCRVRMPEMPYTVEHFDHRRLVVDYVSHEKIVFPRAAV